MAKKKKSATGLIRNRRARFDYELGDSLLVGLVLNGRETKALRRSHGNLQGAYVTVKDGEIWLINATISGDSSAPLNDDEKTQTRKLLAKRREIDALIAAKDQGRTIVPLEILTKGRYIKLRIALGKGRKNYDKRQLLKRKDEQRQINTEIKGVTRG